MKILMSDSMRYKGKVTELMAGEMERAYCRSRQAFSTCAGMPSLTSKLLTKMLVSRTTCSIGGPDGGDRLSHVLLNSFYGDIREPVADMIHYGKTRFSFGDQPVVHVDGNNGYHGLTRTLDDGDLTAVVDASQDIREFVARFSGTHVSDHQPSPILYKTSIYHSFHYVNDVYSMLTSRKGDGERNEPPWNWGQNSQPYEVR